MAKENKDQIKKDDEELNRLGNGGQGQGDEVAQMLAQMRKDSR